MNKKIKLQNIIKKIIAEELNKLILKESNKLNDEIFSKLKRTTLSKYNDILNVLNTEFGLIFQLSGIKNGIERKNAISRINKILKSSQINFDGIPEIRIAGLPGNEFTNFIYNISSDIETDFNFLNFSKWNELLSEDLFLELKEKWPNREIIQYKGDQIPFVQVGDGESVGIYRGVGFVVDQQYGEIYIDVYPDKYKTFIYSAFTKKFREWDNERN